MLILCVYRFMKNILLITVLMLSMPCSTYAAEKTTPADPVVKAVNVALSTAVKRHTFVWCGLAEAEAVKKAKAAAVLFRVVSRDGKPMPATRDYRKGRINAYVWQGRIMGIAVEGAGTLLLEGCRDVAFLPYLGLKEAAAQAMATTKKVSYRVVSKDGEGMAVTADYLPKRVNVNIIAGVLVAVHGG